MAGIHGNESVGCYSIALSGGYEDDLDYGESFTFTGSGMVLTMLNNSLLNLNIVKLKFANSLILRNFSTVAITYQ